MPHLPQTQCPHCQAPTMHHSTRAAALECKSCHWRLTDLLPVVNAAIRDQAVCQQDQSAYLRQLALQAGPAPTPPPRVVSCRAGGTYKARVLPEPDETPVARWERLAAQFELNGGIFRNTPDGAMWATSQRRQDDGQPAKEYRIWYDTRAGVLVGIHCACQTPGDVCAHLAGWHTYLTGVVSSPAPETTSLPDLRDALRVLEAQAGLPPPSAHGAALVALLSDLYGDAGMHDLALGSSLPPPYHAVKSPEVAR